MDEAQSFFQIIVNKGERRRNIINPKEESLSSLLFRFAEGGYSCFEG